jgi:hypothetical protein
MCSARYAFTLRRERYQRRDNLKVFWADFSTKSLSSFVSKQELHEMYTATSRVENSTQVLFRLLKFRLPLNTTVKAAWKQLPVTN